MASISAATPTNPRAAPFTVPAEPLGTNYGMMTEATGTWFKIITVTKQQFPRTASFHAMASLADNCWKWLTKTHPDRCYTSAGGYCIVSCLYVPNENGGCFFLATIPRGFIRDEMAQNGRTKAPIWYTASETNGVIGGGTGAIHAEDAAEWLFEISQFWNGRPATREGGYMPSGQIRLVSWGGPKPQGPPGTQGTSGVVLPCPLPPFENTTKTPPCRRVAQNLGINVWMQARRPTMADEAPSKGSGPGAGPAAGQGGPGVGGPSGANRGAGGQGGAGGPGAAGGSSGAPGAGGASRDTEMMDDLANALRVVTIGGNSRPNSSSSTKTNASTKTVNSQTSTNTASSTATRTSNSSNSTTSSTPPKPGAKPAAGAQQAPGTKTAAPAKTTAAAQKTNPAVKAPTNGNKPATTAPSTKPPTTGPK